MKVADYKETTRYVRSKISFYILAHEAYVGLLTWGFEGFRFQQMCDFIHHIHKHDNPGDI